MECGFKKLCGGVARAVCQTLTKDDMNLRVVKQTEIVDAIEKAAIADLQSKTDEVTDKIKSNIKMVKDYIKQNPKSIEGKSTNIAIKFSFIFDFSAQEHFSHQDSEI